jgi:NTP pyrophosphatase (non-canonical NTP hydrolase)
MQKWEVESDPRTLRRLGKLIEELGELSNVAGRCVIQGIDEVDPGTQKVNRQRLSDEIADVLAQCVCAIKDFGLNGSEIDERAAKKIDQMHEWEAHYDPDEPTPTPAKEGE